MSSPNQEITNNTDDGRNLYTKGDIETPQENRERKISHYITYFTQFNIIMAYSTVLTGLWPFLNKLDPTVDKSFLGYIIAISALGQTVISPLAGKWSNLLNSTRIPFIVSMIICMISYVLHASLECFSENRKYWLLFSRLLAGVGSANISLCRTHISSTTLLSERRRSVSILSLCATIALAVGPIIQWIVIPLGDKGIWIIEGWIKLDMYTGIAWILFILSAINLLLFLPSVFKEHNMLKKEIPDASQEHSYFSKKYKYLAWIFIMLNFIVVFNFMFTKLLGNYYAMDEFAMTRAEAITLNSYVMIASSVVTLVTMAVIHPLYKYFSDLKLLGCGLFLMVIGRCFFYPFGTDLVRTYKTDSVLSENVTGLGCPLSQDWCATEKQVYMWQFIAGNLIESIGYFLAISLTMTMFSKALGSKQQGTWIGMLTAIGSVARILSPVYIAKMYAMFGPAVVTIATNVPFLLLSIILVKLANDYIGIANPKHQENNQELITQNKNVTQQLITTQRLNAKNDEIDEK